MADTQALYTLLNEIYLILDDGDRRLFSRFQLTKTRYYILVHLGEQPGMSLSDLSSRLLCDKSNATRIFQGMEADGLVYRRQHQSDGRSFQLFLSEAGEELREEAMAAHHRYNDLRFDSDPTGDGQDHAESLTQLKQRLRQRLDEATSV